MHKQSKWHEAQPSTSDEACALLLLSNLGRKPFSLIKKLVTYFARLIIILGLVESMNLPTILSRQVCREQSEWPYNLWPSISSLDVSFLQYDFFYCQNLFFYFLREYDNCEIKNWDYPLLSKLKLNKKQVGFLVIIDIL